MSYDDYDYYRELDEYRRACEKEEDDYYYYEEKKKKEQELLYSDGSRGLGDFNILIVIFYLFAIVLILTITTFLYSSYLPIFAGTPGYLEKSLNIKPVGSLVFLQTHKTLSFVIMCVVIALGFVSWDMITAVITNIVLGCASYYFFPNTTVTALIIVSGILYSIISKDYFRLKRIKTHDKVSDGPRAIGHIVRLYCYTEFIATLFFISTPLLSFCIKKTETATTTKEFLPYWLLVTLPFVISMIMSSLQRRWCADKRPDLYRFFSKLTNNKTHYLFYLVTLIRMISLIFVGYILLKSDYNFNVKYILSALLITAFLVIESIRVLSNIRHRRYYYSYLTYFFQKDY